MLLLIFLFIATLFLAYANGANDNFKGVATLFGSKTMHYKSALAWATLTTLGGSVAAILLSQELVRRFSGTGLVPDVFTTSPDFLLAVAFGAAGTVILATLTGFPISTTHSLTGALVGAGLLAAGKQVNFSVLGGKFFMPLLLSPLVAAAIAGGAYLFFCSAREKLGFDEKTTFRMGKTDELSSPKAPQAAYSRNHPEISRRLPQPLRPGSAVIVIRGVLGISARKALDAAHYISGGVVSFARGLNDTPKIVALFMAISALNIRHGMIIVAVAMAAGGLLNARKVAETMSHKITPLNAGQGFAANMVTGLLVVFASRLGMPVSTTHVSVGSLFGIGTITGRGNRKIIGEILLSWLLTLPVAAVLSALIYGVLKMLP